MNTHINGFELGELVVTPLGNLATVEGETGGRVTLCYKGALNKASQSAWVSLPPHLLKRVDKNKPFPAPVLIPFKAAA